MLDPSVFKQAAIAQMVIEPKEDRVIQVNDLARLIFMFEEEDILAMRPSQLFEACLPDLHSFTQEAMHFGKAWTDHLLLTTQYGEVRVEMWGKATDVDTLPVLHLAFHELAHLDALREASAVQQHYRSGIGHWNRVSHVFQEFERENQLILDAAGEGIYGVDADGLTTFVNPAAQQILGYTADELAGENMHSMVHYNHDDGSHFDAHECPIFAAFRDGTVHEIDEDVFWHKDGTPITVEYTSTPIKDNDVIVGAVVIFRDITQKKSQSAAVAGSA
jgi:PAS domain S-box-containing protein